MTEKDALIYTQNCEEFRSLNGFFWQVPLIMMTLNGGLWYSVASLDLSPAAQRGVLWFAVLANFVMIFGLHRLRSVMQDLLIKIHTFQGTEPPGKARRIQLAFQALLLAAAAGALWASCNPSAYFTRTTNNRTTTATRVAAQVQPLLLLEAKAAAPAAGKSLQAKVPAQ